LLQHDLKRLLAYSSVENMGLVAVGLGIGTPLAVTGSLLHILYHGLAKSALFYLAGTISQDYKTKHLMRIRGLFKTAPVLGGLFMLGLLAITGMPPFAVFTSKFLILQAVFVSGHTLLRGVFLLLLGAVFAGMMYYTMSISFGHAHKKQISEPPSSAILAIGLSVCGVLAAGFFLPSWLGTLLHQAAAIVTGG
jgi:hydrogenase-4 component F